MLLESAFFKLPELMLSNMQNRGRVEAMVVHYLATGLQMELNCRSVPFSYNHITVEKPYPVQNDEGSVLRADLLFDASGTVPNTCRLDQYGFKEKQWIEAKTFFSKGNKPNPPKTQNLGKIIKDFLRLCLLPEELQGNIRQNERYVLLVFDAHPSKYLAYSSREWARKMIEEETSKIVIDLKKEPKSLVKSVANLNELDALVEISFRKHFFKPIKEMPLPIYWGYLYRIEKFKIIINSTEISSSGEIAEHWPAEKIKKLQMVRQNYIDILKDNDDTTMPSS